MRIQGPDMIKQRQLFDNIYFFRQIEVGPFHNFTYVLGCPDTKKACLIDPGWETISFLEILKENKFKLEALLLTHNHPDHTQSVEELILEVNPKIYTFKEETHRWSYLSKKIFGLDDNDIISMGNLKLKALYTPGHTQDGLCFIFDNKIFTGDTLFVNGCGRCDLPESSPAKLYDSLYNKLKNLPPNLKVYPGHNYGETPQSTIQEELASNPFLKMKSQEEFIRFRV